MTYLHYPFRIGPHEFVEVRLDRQAQLRLMDDANFWAYRSGRIHRHYGGLAISTPVRLEPPRPGYWHVVVDLGGIWLPSTPVISVVPHAVSLWHVAAVLLAPPVSAWAFHRAAGAALSPGALKLSATQVRSIPVPEPGFLWDRAAQLVEAAHHETHDAGRTEALASAGALMGAAYGLDDDVAQAAVAWWRARLPLSKRRTWA